MERNLVQQPQEPARTPEEIMAIVNSEFPEILPEVQFENTVEIEEWQKIKESTVVPEEKAIPAVEYSASHLLLRAQVYDTLSSITEREHRAIAF